METDPDADRGAARSAMLGEDALDLDGGGEGRCRVVERREETVTGRVHDLPAAGCQDPAQGLVVPPEQLLPRLVAEQLGQRRGADDVGEDERLAGLRWACATLRDSCDGRVRCGQIQRGTEPLEFGTGGRELEVDRGAILERFVGRRHHQPITGDLVRCADLTPR